MICKISLLTNFHFAQSGNSFLCENSLPVQPRDTLGTTYTANIWHVLEITQHKVFTNKHELRYSM